MLSSDQLLRAMAQNPIWERQLSGQGRWPNITAFAAAKVRADDTASTDFATDVSNYQALHGLSADGICGPKTAHQVVFAQPWTPPAGSDYFYFDGKPVPVPGLRSITTPDETGGLAFLPDYPGTWLRSEPIDQVVIHAKGAEGSAMGTWSYLKSKGYGVHGSVERDGKVWAYCDFKKYATAHAGKVNQRSIGFEVTNQMYPLTPNPHGRPVVTGDYVVRDPTHAQYGKPLPRRVLGFLPLQLDSLVKLITAVCDVAGVPKVIPGRDGKIYGGLLPGVVQVPGRWKSVRGIPTFRGVIAHLNVTNGHQDPSPDVFEALLGAGFKLEEV